MSDPLKASLMISGAGLEAQSQRMRVVSQNIANANSTGTTPGSDPYSRKTISFASVMDNQMNIASVKVHKTGTDETPFTVIYEPGHAAANKDGMVKMPNVDLFMEMADMRETLRTYEANMQAIKQARELISMTIDMMRN